MKKNGLLKISLVVLFLLGGVYVTKANDRNENQKKEVTYYDEANNQVLCFEGYPDSHEACMYDPLYEAGCNSGYYRGNIKIPEIVGTEQPFFVTGIRCFDYCEFLLSVDIPKSVEEITASFYYCSNLTTVNIAEGDLYRIDGSFNDCRKLAQVNISEGVTFIKSSFYKSPIETLELPRSVINIGHSFTSMPELKSVNLNQTNIVWDDSFCKCEKLETVVIGSNTEFIEGGSFNDCPSLRRVEIPATGIKIKDSFNGCPAIKEIVIWDDFIPFKGYFQNSFNDVDFANCTLYVPEGSADMYRRDKDGWGRFGKIIDNLPAGVESVAAESDAKTGIYDLMGRRLQVTDPDELPAGLYIINGRKTAIK